MKITKAIDDFINSTTMYRLLIYYLSLLWTGALLLCFLKVIPFSPVDLTTSSFFVFAVCIITNEIFAKVFKAPSNIESVYITALILILIVDPTGPVANLWFFFWVSVLAMASKYIFALHNKHIFNPAAFAVVVTALAINQSASWWVSSVYLAPIVLTGGLALVKKIKRFDMIISFFVVSIIFILFYGFLKETSLILSIKNTFIYTPILFFAFVMFTEPATTPPMRFQRIAYGVAVGFLFSPFAHLGSIYFSPEIALLVGNLFSYALSPKHKLTLKLIEKKLISPDVYDFIFSSEKKLLFEPGQYLEWTLAHKNKDDRGMRRYFTIASSPTEENYIAGIKFYEKSSSFKRSMLELNIGDKIVAGQLDGDFTLPRNRNKKLVFIAGGIGVTPFRSMIKYLIDKNEKRDIIIFNSNKSVSDIVYQDILCDAESRLGIKVINTLTDLNSIPNDWRGETGFVNKEMILRYAPDFKERTFYISGPPMMVYMFKDALKKMGVFWFSIKTDFFPGF